MPWVQLPKLRKSTYSGWLVPEPESFQGSFFVTNGGLGASRREGGWGAMGDSLKTEEKGYLTMSEDFGIL